MARLTRYFRTTLLSAGGKFSKISDSHFEVAMNGQPSLHITTNREAAMEDENLTLLGLEHPLIKQFLDEDRQLEAAARGWIAATPDAADQSGVLTIWHVHLKNSEERYMQRIIPVGLDQEGNRCLRIECLANSIRTLKPADPSATTKANGVDLVRTVIPEMLRRDLEHKGMLSESVTLASRLLAWIELTPSVTMTT